LVRLSEEHVVQEFVVVEAMHPMLLLYRSVLYALVISCQFVGLKHLPKVFKTLCIKLLQNSAIGLRDEEETI
jgi:hypothetical protein